ncbi:RES family NAD+ phosphorylase [Bradyrhizobium sp. U87765 SZCCT0131]|uniref:RES family NAD+ phosphorylase n=1 Tax=unclassified Bradyrhizobium TaxID=2631580 RepID=UPI001BA60C62|nr:RES family NAD+ phosphorylase [Bradyrhizobium sp. U87765 SZCCT0131]MBR1261896.1 RES family NAD+ phosphorylase [Bradyrhizobium sp. U87765 SZCCT0134]MBR1306251.1 RES family NAD+ phosphorylase [Bradyrhizobium sp. U87765 SZCCT0110]MBR1317678.1 RES family NAD+ phosphorylase [Bradyrhizobium sp. U87765 SZCCT0109]MBR1351380.1 RES family NAD+ phosphorylase [Bradyrhizobium sp. U87765 SZCCT0048]
MTDALAAAPQPAHRLIPSQFPPIGLFDTVATAADLDAVMDLVGWTNDRLVAERIHRLPQSEWVFGVPNASIVMAAFLHVAPGGMRFNGPDLGAWYAADHLRTAAAEVGHHLRRETVARGIPAMRRTYRAFSATLRGRYRDIRGQQAAHAPLYASDSYTASQAFGEELRAAGGAGIVYDSVRLRGGVNVVAHRPRNVTAIVQTDHYEITVSATARTIDVRKLTA